jgi:uncharacterized membrane protein
MASIAASPSDSPGITEGKRPRLVSIDALRGLVMLFMLVDHVRETWFLHLQVSDPVDANTTDPGLFFTRMLSAFCAPTCGADRPVCMALWPVAQQGQVSNSC